MAHRRFQLSAGGIGQACAITNNDFTFVVGGVDYPCSPVQACFFSNRVYRMVMSDRTTDRYVLEFPDANRGFEVVMRIMNGEQVEITPSNAFFLELCAKELENPELLAFITESKLDTKIDMSNVLERIQIKRELQQDCSDELKFVASHFHRVELGFALQLTLDELEKILENPALELRSEDDLFHIIHELVEKSGPQYSILYRHVQFQFLDEDNFHAFLDIVFPDSLNPILWRSVCDCLRVFWHSTEKDTMLKSDRYPSYHSEKGPFNGIISYMQAKYGTDLCEKGIIDITASSNDYNHCRYTVDYGWKDYWASYGERDAYLQFDFIQARICVTGYTLTSDGSDYGHLISWVLETSDDGSPSSWEIIDKRSTEDLVGEFVVKTFHCNYANNKLRRFVRLRQTGKNSQGDYDLRLSEIEFFGRLREADL